MPEDRPSWRSRFTALDIAAYATWLAVFVESWQSSARLGAVAGVSARALSVALLLLYLGGFIALNDAPGAAIRRRFLPFAMMIGASVGLVALRPGGTAATLTIILAVCAALYFPPVRTVLLLALIDVMLFVLSLRTREVPDALLSTALVAGFQTFAVLASYSMRHANESAAELRSVNAHLLATRSLLAESARESERLRLSRELHDVSGHKLTALKLNLAALALDPHVAERRELQVAQQLADELLHDIRSVVSQLRAHEGIDIHEALRRLAEPIPTPRVHLHVDADARVASAAHAAALVRVAQEGLTNAARHAAARNVWVRFAPRGAYAELVVEDDGRLATPVQPGHGLSGMRERVEELGGRLEVDRSTAGGLRLRALLPRPGGAGPA